MIWERRLLKVSRRIRKIIVLARTICASLVSNGFLVRSLSRVNTCVRSALVMDEIIKRLSLLREIKPGWQPRSNDDLIWRSIVSSYNFKDIRMQKFITFLFTHATQVGAVCFLILTFLLGRGIIAKDVAYLISGILTILGFAEKPLEVGWAMHVARVAAQRHN